MEIFGTEVHCETTMTYVIRSVNTYLNVFENKYYKIKKNIYTAKICKQRREEKCQNI